jgi:hypothetical protein
MTLTIEEMTMATIEGMGCTYRVLQDPDAEASKVTVFGHGPSHDRQGNRRRPSIIKTFKWDDEGDWAKAYYKAITWAAQCAYRECWSEADLTGAEDAPTPSQASWPPMMDVTP